MHIAVRAAVAANERPLFALAPSAATEVVPSVATQSADKRLALGASVQGFVRLDARSDHWTFDNTAGSRSIVFTLANNPSLNASLSVKDQGGKALPLTKTSPSPGIAPSKSARASTNAPSVALVLDASGSMLQKIKGRQKIEIARAELDHLVRDVLPESTPVTLPVYGQGGKGSCTSDLMMPLAPLDRQRAVQIVAGVKSTNGAKTATAASLHATAQDLSAAHGAKRIILITDGEENCGGDVEKEITELRRSGIDLRLSIVGFAIDSPQVGVMLKHWAQLGGGSYFETHDAPTLDAAMSDAIRPQFDVVDDSGKTVANAGIGSTPITLAAGHYAVRLHGSTDPGMPVEIQTGKNTAISLPQ